MGFDEAGMNASLEVMLAFFDPLIEFFSGKMKTTDSLSGTLSEQVVTAMVGEYSQDTQVVLGHVEKMSACIADLLVFRTLCEVMCTVLQDANTTPNSANEPTSADVIDGM